MFRYSKLNDIAEPERDVSHINGGSFVPSSFVFDPRGVGVLRANVEVFLSPNDIQSRFDFPASVFHRDGDWYVTLGPESSKMEDDGSIPVAFMDRIFEWLKAMVSARFSRQVSP